MICPLMSYQCLAPDGDVTIEECRAEACGWWNELEKCCAMVAISNMGFVAQPLGTGVVDCVSNIKVGE